LQVVGPLVVNGIPVTALLIYFGDVGNPVCKVLRMYVGNAHKLLSRFCTFTFTDRYLRMLRKLESCDHKSCSVFWKSWVRFSDRTQSILLTGFRDILQPFLANNLIIGLSYSPTRPLLPIFTKTPN